LFETDRRKLVRILALGFLPVGLIAVLLTASREGFLAALVALAGSTVILARHHVRRVVSVVFVLPLFALLIWVIVPAGTLNRLATIPEQLLGGDLNQRLNIWFAGWRAFARAPLIGSGAGTFVAAARVAPIDTAHNTALSLLVSGGICALFLASILLALAAASALRTPGPLRVAFVTALFTWTLTSLVATVEENRTTWLLLGTIVLAGRLAREDRCALIAHFTTQHPSRPAFRPLTSLAAQLDS